MSICAIGRVQVVVVRFVTRGVQWHGDTAGRAGLPDATNLDIRDVELPPAPIGGEYGTRFDATGREAGTVAQSQTEPPRRGAESAAQQRSLRTERQDLDAQGLENKRQLGLGPAVLMEAGHHRRDVHGGQ